MTEEIEVQIKRQGLPQHLSRIQAVRQQVGLTQRDMTKATGMGIGWVKEQESRACRKVRRWYRWLLETLLENRQLRRKVAKLTEKLTTK